MKLKIPLFESLSFNAWPAHNMYIFDGWVLRFAGGYTKRSNSVSPLYPGEIPIYSKIDYCKKEYTARKLPLIFKLTDLSPAKKLDNHLAEMGFEYLDETSVQTFNIERSVPYPENLREITEGLEWQDNIDERWLDAFIALQPEKKFTSAEKTAMRGILESIIHPHWFYQLYLNIANEKRCVAAGLGVLQAGYFGISDIMVHPHHRRQGVATRLIKGMLIHAAKEGAHSAYLQVIKSNKPAKLLYAKLGFSEIYRYWYRKQPNQ